MENSYDRALAVEAEHEQTWEVGYEWQFYILNLIYHNLLQWWPQI